MTILECIEMPTTQLKAVLQQVKGAVNGDNYTFIPGSLNTPFMLVAHIDTVARPKVNLKVTSNVVKNTEGVLGADDRAGIYAALRVYTTAKIKPHLLFTDLEEVGGVGAKEVCTSMKCPAGVKLLIELDRKGCNEWVSYEPQHKKVKKYIERFGFVEEYGSYSDIADIGPAWNIASVNLSVGYYHQHSTKETLHLDEMEMSIQRVLSMTEDPIMKSYPPPEDEYRGYCDGYNGYGWGINTKKSSYAPYVGSTLAATVKCCEFCYEPPRKGSKLKLYEGMMMCADCFEWLSTKENRADGYASGRPEPAHYCRCCGLTLEKGQSEYCLTCEEYFGQLVEEEAVP